MKAAEMVGTGGWAYLPQFTVDRLRAYTSKFQFVEVNVTFYRDIATTTARRWRRKVPSDFEFSVKCSRELTHIHQMEPTEESYAVFDRMMDICRELRSSILILQTPPSFNIDRAKIEALRQFFSGVDRNQLTIGWEVRGRLPSNMQQAIAELMNDNDIVHVTDLSVSQPLLTHNIVYTRLFGRSAGKVPATSFGEEELHQIRNRALALRPKKVNYAFHSLRMYEDAERFVKLFKTETVENVLS